MALDFARDATLVAVADHASCELEGEAVVLDLHTGTYYGLDPVGTRVWWLLQQPQTFAGVRDVIVDEFDVTPERCERDMAAFLGSLSAHGLLQPSDAVPR